MEDLESKERTFGFLGIWVLLRLRRGRRRRIPLSTASRTSRTLRIHLSEDLRGKIEAGRGMERRNLKENPSSAFSFSVSLTPAGRRKQEEETVASARAERPPNLF